MNFFILLLFCAVLGAVIAVAVHQAKRKAYEKGWAHGRSEAEAWCKRHHAELWEDK